MREVVTVAERSGLELCLRIFLWAQLATSVLGYATAVSVLNEAENTVREVVTSAPSASTNPGFRSEVHLFQLKYPPQPRSLTVQVLSSNSVRLKWYPPVVDPGGQGGYFILRQDARHHTKSFRVTSPQLVDTDMSPNVNYTYCVRKQVVAALPRISLLSEPTCIASVQTQSPKLVKPLYIAFLEIVALSLVLSVVVCILVQIALVRFKKALRSPAKKQLRQDYVKEFDLPRAGADLDENEPDELSNIIKATSV